MNENIIEVRDLTKTFGSFVAVNSVNFDIKRGEILGFLGPNGAGKTTTIKMITGLLKISSGSVTINGLDAVRHSDVTRMNIGYMSQKFSLYPKLTALENIEFFAGISGLNKKEISGKYKEIKRYVPENLLKQNIEKLPPGIKQRVALFAALVSDPGILLLDEPTSGVDPVVRRDFWQEIYSLKKRGKTILVTTHNLDEVEYADKIVILHRGKIIVEGEPEILLAKTGKDSIEELFKEAVKENEGN